MYLYSNKLKAYSTSTKFTTITIVLPQFIMIVGSNVHMNHANKQKKINGMNLKRWQQRCYFIWPSWIFWNSRQRTLLNWLNEEEMHKLLAYFIGIIPTYCAETIWWTVWRIPYTTYIVLWKWLKSCGNLWIKNTNLKMMAKAKSSM